MDHLQEETYLFLALLALIGWVFWLIFRRYQTGAEVRIQRIASFNRLIEKFGTAKEFADFAQSEEGKKILADPVAPPYNPLTKVLRFLQAGVLLVIIGIAFFVNASNGYLSDDPVSHELYYRRMNEFNSYGTLSLLLGIGSIVLAGVTWVFVRRWRLANGSSGK
ncbi:MAG TPA: hypothetical protein VL633_07640 [Bacteroidota bacterium]|jgi:drug/metabolite transporter (DMT)-like permease|nr:hypothetical protein [Bacteroidota bacterium]